ncbi:MAG: transposase [Anaerolineaceae bacterium]
MTYNPAVHHRRSIRLPEYDYSQAGAYFITLCAHQREYLFGEIVDGEMKLNEFGQIVQSTWHDLVNHVARIELDAFVIMPNHIHGIITIVGAGSEPARTEPARTEPARTEPARTEPARTEPARTEPAPTTDITQKQTPLSEIVRQLKTFSARRINLARNTPGEPVWQRNYYEHIIRDEKSYNAISEYILDNPAKWELDSLFSGRTS